jgi:hypothetical protein
MLESDPDLKTPTVEISEKEIFVFANSPTFIDLNTKLESNVPASVAITSQTRHGDLTDLGNGLLQYIPSAGDANSRDAFEFTVLTSSSQILKRDSIIIIIEKDSTHLPCNIYPVPDSVHVLREVPVLINVTKNDVICGGSVTVSIFKPGNSFPPHFGQAEVQGSRILYSPGPGFNGADKIIYKLTGATDSSRSAYGVVYLTGDSSSCSFKVSDDLYVYGENVKDSLLSLPVFSNDSLCEPMSQYQVNLKSQPLHGQASITPNNIQYKVPVSPSLPLIDSFEYELCINATCKTARVNVMVQADSVGMCTPLARPDSITLAIDDASIKYLDVLENDSICQELTSFKITVPPLYGNSARVDNTISYQRTSNPDKDDLLKYEICNSSGCSSATVLIKRKD